MDSRAASYDLRLLGLALTPSIFSSIFCVVFTLLLVGGLVIDVRLKDSFLHIIFFDWSNMSIGQTGDTTFAIVMQDLSNRASAFVVWALFAVFIIVVCGAIYQTVRNLKSLNTELTDQYLIRKTILSRVLQRLGVHAATVVVWALYGWLFFAFIVPYVIAASLVGAVTFPTLEGIGYIIVATVIISLALHLHIVFLRVLLLRPRVFGSANSVLSAQ